MTCQTIGSAVVLKRKWGTPTVQGKMLPEVLHIFRFIFKTVVGYVHVGLHKHKHNDYLEKVLYKTVLFA